MHDIYQGSLFSSDFLSGSIERLEGWRDFDDTAVDALAARLGAIFARFPHNQTPNESQTEDDLIWPILTALGWSASLRQQNLSARGRDDVPDGLLFADDAAKARANQGPEEWRRYAFGLAVVESKRWNRPLDRQSGRRGEETAPSTQMLRYLRRVEDLSTGALRWGILTNGGRWRIYYQGARSVADQYFDLDLAAVLGVPGHDGGLFAVDADARRRWLRVFALIFRREAFLGTASDKRTFHQRALEEGRFYEERVAANLSDLVFGEVFPLIARAIAGAAPDAPLPDVRDAALILLYRLLFILYAEDRDLLPIRDSRYAEYGLRDKVRMDVGRRMDNNDIFSSSAARYWGALDDLSRAIDTGDGAIGLPPYNGGLFDRERTPLLTEVRLSDAVMACVVDALSFERTPEGRRYINYRDMSVQQLGSIYERLLEHELVRDGELLDVRPNVFARKGSGSYYTPDDLVALIVRETIDPLVEQYMDVFRRKVDELATSPKREHVRIDALKYVDPTLKLLELRICDPAMGSGHFLVFLVDYLADRIIATMAETEAMVTWGEYVSPLSTRIEPIRTIIVGNALERGWTFDYEQLDDRHIVRRIVLKRSVYGVDKNKMAVELAKVALWLHTFTVGAPLSFLDHHLRHGDSLFGLWITDGMRKASGLGGPLFLHEPMNRALRAAKPMRTIELLADAEIAEAHESKEVFEEVVEMTEPLNAILCLLHVIDWLKLNAGENRVVLQSFFTGVYGDPLRIAMGQLDPLEKIHDSETTQQEAERLVELLAQAKALIAEEGFFNWQAAFPGVWSNWEGEPRSGGFDAVVGNPPWDRMKLQQVEWFAARRRDIALSQRASDRKRMIGALAASGDSLAGDYAKAEARAETGLRMARSDGQYPLLSGGDVNLYSLFVERAMSLVKPDGIVGLLTPSGIASDLTAAVFFKGVSTTGRLKTLYDFENKKVFFSDVHASFKFCVTVMSPERKFDAARCAFFLHTVGELHDPERCFALTAEDFARVNPNTGTAPIFRSRRDARLAADIYGRLPVLIERTGNKDKKAWPVRYSSMLHMTNDSIHFRTRRELEEADGAYPVDGGRFRGAKGEYLPLYEGKMVQAFDHRAASIFVNPNNQHRPAQPASTTIDQKQDPSFFPEPQFWVAASALPGPSAPFLLGFKDVTAPTNARTMIAAIIPGGGVGNTFPVLLGEMPDRHVPAVEAAVFSANFNAIVFDFVARQKVQGQHLNWYIVEQLPVVPLDRYSKTRYGKKSAGQVIREAVLELTYTAHDMAPFAREMGYVDSKGKVKPPFKWDENRRQELRAKLDAIYFNLYGIVDREDIRYIYSTFPIVERTEIAAHGRYRSRDLCLAWMNALAADDPDARIRL